MLKCVFLDRDGVINLDTNYVYKFSDIIWNKHIFKIIKFLKKNKIKICVVTNQSGIARGYFTEEDVKMLHKKMNLYIFNKIGHKIDQFKYCPFLTNAKIDKYKKDSYDRKPNPGMINSYIKKKKLEKKNCIMIGDKRSDYLCGKKAGIKSFQIKNKNFFNLIKKEINNS